MARASQKAMCASTAATVQPAGMARRNPVSPNRAMSERIRSRSASFSATKLLSTGTTSTTTQDDRLDRDTREEEDHAGRDLARERASQRHVEQTGRRLRVHAGGPPPGERDNERHEEADPAAECERDSEPRLPG